VGGAPETRGRNAGRGAGEKRGKGLREGFTKRRRGLWSQEKTRKVRRALRAKKTCRRDLQETAIQAPKPLTPLLERRKRGPQMDGEAERPAGIDETPQCESCNKPFVGERYWNEKRNECMERAREEERGRSVEYAFSNPKQTRGG